MEDDTRTTANLIGNPLKLDIDVELKGFISALGGAYRVLETDTTSLNLLAGARYLWLEADLDIAIGPGISQNYKDSGHVWDAIAGIRGKTELSNKWYLTYYLDAGREIPNLRGRRAEDLTTDSRRWTLFLVTGISTGNLTITTPSMT